MRWLFALMLCLPVLSLAAEIIVITNGQYPITVPPGIDAAVYDIDRQTQAERDLTRNLPKDPRSIAAEMRKRLARISREDLQKIWGPRILAWKYGIRKVPAVIFDDGAAVVYGVTDINEAIRRWKEYSHDR